MSWLTDIEAVRALMVLLDSVFVSGNAEPETSVYVMATCGSLLFIVLGIPKLKSRQKRAQQVEKLNSVDLRRLAGT